MSNNRELQVVEALKDYLINKISSFKPNLTRPCLSQFDEFMNFLCNDEFQGLLCQYSRFKTLKQLTDEYTRAKNEVETKLNISLE